MVDVDEQRGLLGSDGGGENGNGEGEAKSGTAEHDHHSNPQRKRPELVAPA
jgi:hypothetical protein